VGGRARDAHATIGMVAETPMLTAPQAAALKAAMLADTTVQAMVGQDQNVANYYNAASATAIWRNNIDVQEIINTVTATAGVLVGLTAAKSQALLVVTQAPVIDATQAGIRQAFSDIFTGTAVLAALTALAQRMATRYEALAAFITAAAPANLSSVVGYQVSDLDVNQARNS